MDLQLDERSVLITAASKGLGKEVARVFVNEGASVVISSRSEENLCAARADILDKTDARSEAVEYLTCNLSDAADIRSLVDEAVDRLGGLDVLVTNHGGPPAQTFAKSSIEDFDEAYRSVLRSTIILVKEALPHIHTGDGGAITNMVSASAQEPPTGHVLSNTIRPGIYGLSKSLSNEYADKGVRVNAVCPRGIMTDRLEYKIEVLADQEEISIEEASKRRRNELPIDRLGDPAEFARAVAFISSPAASFVTGSTFRIDGGWAAHLF